jgi:hypothetical protein
MTSGSFQDEHTIMSKGSKPRPTNKLQFDENYSNIKWNREPKLTNKQMKELINVVKKRKLHDENNN